MKPDIPSLPCPARAVAKACYSSHKRCTIERLSLSLFHSPSFFYSSLVLVLPVGKARCQPLPKAGQSALTPYANDSPLAQLIHSFSAPHHHILLLSFIYFFPTFTLQSFSLQHFSLSCTSYCCCTSTISPSGFCLFTRLFTPSSSIAIHLQASLTVLPLTPFTEELLFLVSLSHKA